jgi:hypothetical protein
MLKKVIIVALLLLVFPAPAMADDAALPPFTLHLFAADNDLTYLGKLTTDATDPDSVFNIYGPYGNKYSATCIFNEYGRYGGAYSSYSPFNEYTSSPPYIICISNSTGRVLGINRLTVNSFIPDSLDPTNMYINLKEFGL